MSKLLYIEASPRKSRSKSIQVAGAFLDAYRQSHPEDTVETIDLWEYPLPEFDGFTIDAKYQVLHGESFSDQQHDAWQSVVKVCDHFKSADKYLFSLPMWNFGVPYKLKHYIDVLAQPGQTFSFSPESGYSGLVTGKPAVAIYARGGDYSEAPADSMDYQQPYLKFLLGFLGFTEIHELLIEPTLSDPDQVQSKVETASQKATELASRI